jgi:hypothetical protein
MGTTGERALNFFATGVAISFAIGAEQAIVHNHVEEPHSVIHPETPGGRGAIHMVQGVKGPSIGRTPRAVTEDVINRAWTPGDYTRIAASPTTSAAIL